MALVGQGPEGQIRNSEAGERDLSFGEILSRAAALCGGPDWCAAYVLTNYKESQIDPATGKKVFPRRFCISKFRTQADRDKPRPQRAQDVLAQGASWSEALARAAIALRGGNP